MHGMQPSGANARLAPEDTLGVGDPAARPSFGVMKQNPARPIIGNRVTGGEMPTGTPLTTEQIETIKSLNQEGMEKREIARRVGVSTASVDKIVHGWRTRYKRSPSWGSITFSLPKNIYDTINQEVERGGVTRSAYLKEMIEDHFERKNVKIKQGKNSLSKGWDLDVDGTGGDAGTDPDHPE